ncbi:MAG: pseudouridine synthase [Candidatus Shikimatogenerans sp. JK-2022]|nr:pseudouridine synthase [Candidatus Shikimatogenerans bostrichidophilus]
MKKIRINKYIALSGICSRRKADNLIKLGLISINDNIIYELGKKIILNKDIIKYDNKIIKILRFLYIIINKPKNCIITLKDNKNKKNRLTIFNFIPNKFKKYRIFPVGRLDQNTTGILLLTNDGFLCNKLLHPKYKIKKDYKIILNKKIKKNIIFKLNKGLIFKEGKIKITKIKIKKNNKNILIISIHIGWNKIIHRIFNKLGYKILYLQRINFGGIKIYKDIKKEGQYKILSKKKLYNILNIIKKK